MLVCSVSTRAKRGTLAAAIVETASAVDAPTIAAIFAILADDSGNALDILDAFNGKMMVEAASAAATVNAGSIRNAAIVEETNAAATFGGVAPHIVVAAIAETATADSVQDGAIATATITSAVLDGAFIDPRAPSSLLGTDVLDSGPITVLN